MTNDISDVYHICDILLLIYHMSANSSTTLYNSCKSFVKKQLNITYLIRYDKSYITSEYNISYIIYHIYDIQLLIYHIFYISLAIYHI